MNREVIETIERALLNGSSVEVKKERDNIVVIELARKVKIKSPITGSDE
jgi:hypothetical protein